MCNENINNILSLDFSSSPDETNWQTDSTNPLQTVGGKLVLNLSSNDSMFQRILGAMDPTNNRVKIKSNINVTKTINGSSTTEILFELFEGSQKVNDLCVPFNNMEDGEEYAHYVDLNFEVKTTSNLILKITVPEGWQNKIELNDLIVDDFNYCIDNIRTYFVIDGLLEDSLTAMSSGIELKEWKVDGVETLTPAYFSENNSIGGNPVTQWRFAKANLDGSDRVQDNVTPNTFNPFSDEFGLVFDSVASFYGGKPTGTISGSNYGTGILDVGFEKPAILNRGLQTKKGAFFIDIDYTKDLKVVFDVLSNQNSSNVFSGPSYYRQYTLEWDSKRCTETFTYVDVLTNDVVDELNNGFLTGVSSIDVLSTVVQCDESFSPTGQSGNFTYDLDFGSDTGVVGIEYNAYSVPDRFLIEYDGVVYDSGFVGSNSYDSQLIAAGVDPADINTGSPSTGAGSLTFSKPNSFPTQGKVTVLAPLGSTGWTVKGVCASSSNAQPNLDIQPTSLNTGFVGVPFSVDLIASDDGVITSWEVDWKDGTVDTGTGHPPSTLTHTYASPFSGLVLFRVFDDGGLTNGDSTNISIDEPLPTDLIVVTEERLQITSNANVFPGADIMNVWSIMIDVPKDDGYSMSFERVLVNNTSLPRTDLNLNSTGNPYSGLDFDVQLNEFNESTVFDFNTGDPDKFAFVISKSLDLGVSTVSSSIIVKVFKDGSEVQRKTFIRIHS